jgi:hypothetical protein
MTSNPFDYVRRYYGVPAKRLGRVRIWTGEDGTITSAYQHNLRIRLDGQEHVGVYHPAYGLYYYDGGVQT